MKVFITTWHPLNSIYLGITIIYHSTSTRLSSLTYIGVSLDILYKNFKFCLSIFSHADFFFATLLCSFGIDVRYIYVYQPHVPVLCLLGWSVITWPLGWSDPSIGCAWSILSLLCPFHFCPDVFHINLFFTLIDF